MMSAALETSTSSSSSRKPCKKDNICCDLTVHAACDKLHDTMVAAYGEAGVKPLNDLFIEDASLFGWTVEVHPESGSRKDVLAAFDNSIKNFKKDLPSLSKVTYKTGDFNTKVVGDIAIAHGVNELAYMDDKSAVLKEIAQRFTYVFAKENEEWKVRHFHSSQACPHPSHVE